MDSSHKRTRTIKYIIAGLPLSGAAVSAFLPLSQIVHQLMVLAVLVWIQVFFVFDVLKAGG